jgi:hypothetical protein
MGGRCPAVRRIGCSEVRHVLAYFLLVGMLTLPFWFVSSSLGARLLPDLPFSALAVVVPTISASIVALVTGGTKAVTSLFACVVRAGHNRTLACAVALTVPFVVPIASWHFAEAESRVIAPAGVLVAVVPVILLAAIAEEIGWSAYVRNGSPGGSECCRPGSRSELSGRCGTFPRCSRWGDPSSGSPGGRARPWRSG